MEKLLDLSQPLDVALLDSTVKLFYENGTPYQRTEAEKILKQLQEMPETWTRVDAILEQSTYQNTKYFALQVLESVIKYRWNALPKEQREGIKTYVSNKIIQMATNESLFRKESVFLDKLNLILVQILKNDWPHRWTSFIPDIVSASKHSETLCENMMTVLKILSEEVFDFSRGQMTQAKVKDLKQSLNNEFAMIYELCIFALEKSQSVALLRATMKTLHAFLSWIPLGYIFESNLINILLKYLPNPQYRNISLMCLTEIGGLNVGNLYQSQFVPMYTVLMTQLLSILPPSINIREAYASGSDDEQQFLMNLASFFTSFLKVHISLLESSHENHVRLITGMDYLIALSYVEEVEVFKICLDYWNTFVCDLYGQTECALTPTSVGQGWGAFTSPPRSDSGGGGLMGAAGDRTGLMKQLYAETLSKLRMLMICRMAKPEEVILVEDENGNIVRETMKDNDVLTQYKVMRETLIYLSHLNHADTEEQMTSKLKRQLTGEEWSWNNLNTLCWAIGSVSGSMAEDQENRFLVNVIRDLLTLCEQTKGKEHKAVIASNIMYVVGQYPRFLRAHWKFLKTVVNKLFEFMHEKFPGVKEMACDTFLKISNKCKKKFVMLQPGESEPFLLELLRSLETIINELETGHIHVFYEAVGLMVGAENEHARREEYLSLLMDPPNYVWAQIIQKARENPSYLTEKDVPPRLAHVIQTNTAVCSALGQAFYSQMSANFQDVLNVYMMYSTEISNAINQGGPHASKSTFVKSLRSVKKAILRLIETYIQKTDDLSTFRTQYVPAMMDPILGDYNRNVPDARDAEVLSLFTTIIDRVQNAMSDEVNRIFEATFECTLAMITKNFEDYPEHRLRFVSLLRAIAQYCFMALYTLQPNQLKLVMNSVVWAFRHTERNVAETGLLLLLDVINSFQKSDRANQFFQEYYMEIMREIFTVLTDTFHKPGFKLHALVLQHLFTLVASNVLSQPLWDAASRGPQAYVGNTEYVLEQTNTLLTTSFPNMKTSDVSGFVNGMFELHAKKDFSSFKNHLRDFLVASKEFAGDNEELFAEEKKAEQDAHRQRIMHVPGMIPVNEQADDGMVG